MAKTTADPIFTAFAKSAPLLDLQFYINYANRHAHEYTERTLGIKADMVVLAASLKGSPAAQKRAVWAIIAAFKASIAGWSGTAGTESMSAAEFVGELANESEAA